MRSISRREFLYTGAVGVSGLALARRRGGRTTAAPTKLRMSWWGSQDSNKNQLAAVKQMEKEHPQFSIAGEFSSYDDYWPRLATEVSGGNAPDMILMDITHMTEYASRGVMIPLNQYVGHVLHLGDYDQGARNSATVDGKLYGVARGFTTPSVAFDKVTLDKLQISIPGNEWTWEDYAKVSADVAQAAGPGFYGSEDASGAMEQFELFVRGRGKQLYHGSSLGFKKSDLSDWFGFWDNMRKTRGCVTPDIQASYQSKVENSPLINGKSALQWTNSDAILGLQPLTQHQLVLHVPPRTAGKNKPSGYLFATSFLTCYTRSKNRDSVIKAIDYLCTDVKVNEAYNLESGPSPFKHVRNGVMSSLDPLAKSMFEYSNLISSQYSTPAPPPPPKGWSQVVDLLTRTSQDVAFKKTAASTAVDSFFSQAHSMLSSA